MPIIIRWKYKYMLGILYYTFGNNRYFNNIIVPIVFITFFILNCKLLNSSQGVREDHRL